MCCRFSFMEYLGTHTSRYKLTELDPLYDLTALSLQRASQIRSVPFTGDSSDSSDGEDHCGGSDSRGLSSHTPSSSAESSSSSPSKSKTSSLSPAKLSGSSPSKSMRRGEICVSTLLTIAFVILVKNGFILYILHISLQGLGSSKAHSILPVKLLHYVL